MRLLVRRLATTAGFKPPQAAPIVFDTSVKARQKERAAGDKDAREFDYLRDEVAARVVDRVGDMARTFPHALDMYCGSGHILRALQIWRTCTKPRLTLPQPRPQWTPARLVWTYRSSSSSEKRMRRPCQSPTVPWTLS
jgi:hypothetical protein